MQNRIVLNNHDKKIVINNLSRSFGGFGPPQGKNGCFDLFAESLACWCFCICNSAILFFCWSVFYRAWVVPWKPVAFICFSQNSLEILVCDMDLLHNICFYASLSCFKIS